MNAEERHATRLGEMREQLVGGGTIDDSIAERIQSEDVEYLRVDRPLLELTYKALNAIMRLGYPLDPNWPSEADEAYKRLGDLLWPDSQGRLLSERLSDNAVGDV